MFDPKTNIGLGTLYIKFLKSLFANKIYFMIAAYNAGEEAVARWMAVREKEIWDKRFQKK